jgi:hypothetical protein
LFQECTSAWFGHKRWWSNNPERQRGDGVKAKSVPSLTLRAIQKCIHRSH